MIDTFINSVLNRPVGFLLLFIFAILALVFQEKAQEK
jgi:hypothetical protein